MTCEELKTIVDTRNPWECTRAEVAAFFVHFHECPTCAQYVRMKEGREMSPEEYASLRAKSHETVEDSEAREMCRKAIINKVVGEN